MGGNCNSAVVVMESRRMGTSGSPTVTKLYINQNGTAARHWELLDAVAEAKRISGVFVLVA